MTSNRIILNLTDIVCIAKMCILFINESISSLAYVDMLLMVGFFFS